MAIGSSALDAASPLKGERAAMDTTWKWFVGGVVLAALSLVPVLPGGAQEVPDTIQIDSLSHLYNGVNFNHAMHIDIAGGCAVCHHRGPGALAKNEKCGQCHPNAEQEQVKACRACHPADPFSAATLRERDSQGSRHHSDILGLKGAYHQGCTGCHAEMGGPTGCQGCHSRTEVGDAFYHAGKYAPKAGAAETERQSQ